jgi:hypothetical protein
LVVLFFDESPALVFIAASLALPAYAAIPEATKTSTQRMPITILPPGTETNSACKTILKKYFINRNYCYDKQ